MSSFTAVFGRLSMGEEIVGQFISLTRILQAL